jgi:hypothetical protein
MQLRIQAWLAPILHLLKSFRLRTAIRPQLNTEMLENRMFETTQSKRENIPTSPTSGVDSAGVAPASQIICNLTPNNCTGQTVEIGSNWPPGSTTLANSVCRVHQNRSDILLYFVQQTVFHLRFAYLSNYPQIHQQLLMHLTFLCIRLCH